VAFDPSSVTHLHDKLVEVLGKQAADELMNLLPPLGAEDVATKTELDRLAQSLRYELRGVVKLEVARLRLELVERLGELSGKINKLQIEMSKRYGDLRVEVAKRRGIALR